MMNSIASVMKVEEEGIPQSVKLAQGSDTDIYCEVGYDFKETSFEVSWRLRNDAV